MNKYKRTSEREIEREREVKCRTLLMKFTLELVKPTHTLHPPFKFTFTNVTVKETIPTLKKGQQELIEKSMHNVHCFIFFMQGFSCFF